MIRKLLTAIFFCAPALWAQAPDCGLKDTTNAAHVPSNWSSTQPNGHGNLQPAPTEGNPYTDPLGNCKIHVVIDRANQPAPTSATIFPDYSKRASINLDASAELLARSSGGVFVVSLGANGERTGSGRCAAVEAGGVWSHLTANLVYYPSGKTLRSMNTDTCATALVHTFSASYSSVTIGGGESEIVLSDSNQELVPIIGIKSAGGHDFVPYNITTDTVTGTYDCGTATTDTASMFSNGKGMVRGASAGTGTCQGISYINSDGTLNRHVATFNNAGTHGDTLTSAGVDYFIGNWDASDPCTSAHGILATRMDNDAKTCLKTWQNAGPNAGSLFAVDGHVAVRGEWVLFSAHITGGVTKPMALEADLTADWDNTTTKWGRQGFAEVFLIRFSTLEVWLLASNWNSSNNFGSDYRAQAHCNASIAVSGAGVPKWVTCGFNFRTGVANENAYNIEVVSTGGPTLSVISPTSKARGTTANMTLTGTGFQGGGASVSVTGGGITVQNLVVVNDTSITVDFVIDAGATISTRSVSVTTNLGTSGTQPFDVTAGAGPTLTALDVTSGVQGRTPFLVTLTGTNFDGSATINISGTGVTATPTFISPTSIVAIFTVAVTAQADARNVSVTTGAGTSGNQTFTVLAKPVVNVSGWDTRGRSIDAGPR